MHHCCMNHLSIQSFLQIVTLLILPVSSMILSVEKIPTWTKYFIQHQLKSNYAGPPENLYQVRQDLNDKVSHWTGDIMMLQVDAIVNAANKELKAEGGVCQAIHAKAGPKLEAELQNKSCSPGEAVITQAYDLPSKYVIHAVGPTGEKSDVLAKAYESSLAILVEHGLRTIAFPCISTGTNGYPNECAAHVALRAARHFLIDNAEKVDRVLFCTSEETDKLIYDELMQRYFPLQ